MFCLWNPHTYIIPIFDVYTTNIWLSYIYFILHSYVINHEMDAVNKSKQGTKVAAYYVLSVPPQQERHIYLRLTDDASMPAGDPFGSPFENTLKSRLNEANSFYSKVIPQTLGPQQQLVSRQAYAGEYYNPVYIISAVYIISMVEILRIYCVIPVMLICWYNIW